MILTPDHDLYVEVAGLRAGDPDGTVPMSLRGESLYAPGPSDLPQSGELPQWIAEARGLAQLEGAAFEALDEHVWVFAESQGSHVAGDAATQPLDAEVGHRGLIHVDD